MGSIVTFVIIGICGLAFFTLSPDSSYKYGIMPLQIKRGQYYRIITGAFLHASISHLFMNMFSLYNIGAFLETFVGSPKFAIILGLSIVASSLAITFFGKPDTITVGMSGGLYGLLGYYVVLLFKLGILFNSNVSGSLIRVLLINLAISLMPGVSLLGHLGGFVVGALLGFII